MFIAVVLWIAGLVGYYTVYFHITHLGGDYFYNILAFGIIEILAYGVTGLLTVRFGTKKGYIGSFVLTVLAVVPYLLVWEHHPEYLPAVLALAAFGIIWTMNINWNGNAALFPTIFASSANGLCNLAGRSSSAFSPQISQLP